MPGKYGNKGKSFVRDRKRVNGENGEPTAFFARHVGRRTSSIPAEVENKQRTRRRLRVNASQRTTEKHEEDTTEYTGFSYCGGFRITRRGSRGFTRVGRREPVKISEENADESADKVRRRWFGLKSNGKRDGIFPQTVFDRLVFDPIRLALDARTHRTRYISPGQD